MGFFHQHSDHVDWVFVDHPSYHRAGALLSSKGMLCNLFINASNVSTLVAANATATARLAALNVLPPL